MRVGLKWSYKGAFWFYFFKLMCLHSKRATWKQTSKLKFAILNLHFSSVQSLSRVWLFATPWIAARQASLSPITNSWSELRLTSIESVMPSSHLILCHPLLLLPPMLCYAMLSHFSRVWLCVTPWTAAHQAAPSLVFSRQEHWSGLPFPSPMNESEKWKWSRSVVSDS